MRARKRNRFWGMGLDKRQARRARRRRVIPCPECAVRTYGPDDRPNPPTKGPGCFFCGGKGEVSADMRLPSLWRNHTVQDLLDHKRSRR